MFAVQLRLEKNIKISLYLKLMSFISVSLKKMWESFGFITNIYKDYTYDQVLQLFRSLSLENHSSYDAFVVCYLSHGDEGKTTFLIIDIFKMFISFVENIRVKLL